MKHLRFYVCLFVFVAAVWSAEKIPAHAADATYRWKTLAQVQRVAIVTPFLCTDTLSRKPDNAQERTYRNALRAVTTTLQKSFPDRVRKQTRFQIASPQAVQKALRALHWTARDLFLDKAALTNFAWPTPAPKHLVTLAKRLHVDAVLISCMREPASIREGVQIHHQSWNPNPLNWSLQRIHAHVDSPRVRALLITSRGTVAWQDEEMASYPRTKPSTPHTLLLDWQAATEEVAQQLVDSLNRLPPPDQAKG